MKRIIALSILLGFTLPALVARADEASEREARVLFAEGYERLQKGDYEGALGPFQGAYRLYPSVKILLNIGTTLRQLGRKAEAANAYEVYLKDAKGDPKKRAEVEQILRELDTQLAKLQIDVSDPAMSVRVDGKSVVDMGKPILIRVEPGTHKIEGEKDGSAPVVETVAVIAQQERKILLSPPLSPPMNAPAPAPALPANPTPSAPKPIAPSTTAAGRDDKIVQGGKSVAKLATGEWEPAASHGKRLGAFVRVDIQGQGHGVVMAPGLSYGIGDHLEVEINALLGRNQGFEPGFSVFILRGKYKPLVSLGAPIFWVNGAWAGVHASAGFMWDPLKYLGVFAQAGASLFPSVPIQYANVVFIPSVGVQSRFW